MLLFDTETTGLPRCRDQAYKGPGNWPHIVSIAWIIIDSKLNILKKEYFIIKPQWDIPLESIRIHGISYNRAMKEGSDLKEVLDKFWEDLGDKPLIAHNIEFDSNVLVNAEMWDLKRKFPQLRKLYCTMDLSRNMLKLPGNYGYKNPKLSELYEYVLKKKPLKEELHNSLKDTEFLYEIIKNSSDIQFMIGLLNITDNNTNEIQNKTRTLYL